MRFSPPLYSPSQSTAQAGDEVPHGLASARDLTCPLHNGAADDNAIGELPDSPGLGPVRDAESYHQRLVGVGADPGELFPKAGGELGRAPVTPVTDTT